MLDMCTHDDDVVLIDLRSDDDALLYEHELCC